MLAGAGFAGRLFGAAHRVLLMGVIGAQGYSIYSSAYPMFALLLMVSSSGMPVAIAKLVSESAARGNTRAVKRVFRVSLTLLIALGAVTTVIMLALAKPIAAVTGDAAAWPAYTAIAPSLVLVAMLSAYRGYFQGMQRMGPMAASQIVEQAVRLALGIYIAHMWVGGGVAMGAAGAMAGMTLSQAAALVFLAGAKKGESATAPCDTASSGSEQGLLKMLLGVAAPITLGSMALPLVGMIDSAIVKNKLLSIGYTLEEMREQFGVLTGSVGAIVNLPTAFAGALAVSVVPAISAYLAKGRRADAMRVSATGFRLVTTLGFPITVGLWMLALPLHQALFSGNMSRASMLLGESLLKTMSVASMLMMLVQTSTAVLQGEGRTMAPVISMVAGAVVKIIVNDRLVGIPTIGIHGAPIGSIACYCVALGTNIAVLTRKSGLRLRLKDVLAKPALASVAMGATLSLPWFAGLSPFAHVIFGALIGALTYFAVLVALGGVTEEDARRLPHAAHAALSRLRLIRASP